MASKKELATCDWVYVLCRNCGGFESGCADIRGLKTVLKNDLLWAARDGKQVVIRRHDEPRMNGCSCEWTVPA